MTDKVSNLIITILISGEDSIKPFKFIPKTDGRFLSIIYGREKIFLSVSFKKISLDDFLNAFGKNRQSLQKNCSRQNSIKRYMGFFYSKTCSSI